MLRYSLGLTEEASALELVVDQTLLGTSVAHDAALLPGSDRGSVRA